MYTVEFAAYPATGLETLVVVPVVALCEIANQFRPLIEPRTLTIPKAC